MSAGAASLYDPTAETSGMLSVAEEHGITTFINAELIAAGLSPFAPELAGGGLC